MPKIEFKRSLKTIIYKLCSRGVFKTIYDVEYAMTTLQDFEKEIRERENLLKNILLHWRDYKFLSAPANAGLIRFFTKHPIFGRSKEAIFKLLCIEVHKLFSDLKSDHFKWTQLLHKIKRDHKKSDWKDQLSSEDIRYIERLINNGLKNGAIQKLREYRNKYLVHTDEDRTDTTFFLRDFDQLIDISLKIINLLRTKILNQQSPLEMFIQADGFDGIRALAAE
jgi:hypothetical protein